MISDIEQPESFTVTFSFNNILEAKTNYDNLDPFLKQFIEEDMIKEEPCDCGCGVVRKVVSKEDIDQVIDELKIKRQEQLN